MRVSQKLLNQTQLFCPYCGGGWNKLHDVQVCDKTSINLTRVYTIKMFIILICICKYLHDKRIQNYKHLHLHLHKKFANIYSSTLYKRYTHLICILTNYKYFSTIHLIILCIINSSNSKTHPQSPYIHTLGWWHTIFCCTGDLWANKNIPSSIAYIFKFSLYIWLRFTAYAL